MKNETNTTAVRNSNTPGTIAFILALVSGHLSASSSLSSVTR